MSSWFWSTVLQCGARLPIHTLNSWQWFEFFNWGMLECDIAHRRSVAAYCMMYNIRCSPLHHFILIYRCRMCKCRLPAGLWSNIGIIMRLLAAESLSTAWFFSLLSIYVQRSWWPWRVLWAGYAFYMHKLRAPFSPLLFSFLFILSIGWYFGAGVFDFMIVCKSLSSSLALPTFLTTTNNNLSKEL